MSVDIKNNTRRPLAARAVFSKIAKEVLPKWDISLVFVGPKKARKLNKQLRGKDYIPNVLSYRVDAGAAVPDEALAKSGEIIICPNEAAKQASNFHLTPSIFHLYLFIHGLLHLKGWAHGVRMERCEQKLLAQFADPYGAANSNRHRHRHLPDKNGGGRRAHR